MKALKNELRDKGVTIKVLKKRLLALALKDASIEFDALQQKTPLATIFSPVELSEVAGTIYRFGKQFADKDGKFDVLGVYDNEASALVSREDFLVIAQLPSREVLLAQVMGGITGPLRAFMSIVDQLSKKEPVNEAPAAEPAVEAPTEAEKPAEEAAPAPEAPASEEAAPAASEEKKEE
ncbi:MAG: 50S ribosomal protein L10 [Candidatus Paceibacterota bacterium]